MRLDKFKILIVLFSVFLLEIASICTVVYYKREKSIDEYMHELDIMKVKHAKEKNNLTTKYEKKKYHATGKNVYERIYNKKSQSIIELIDNLAMEALPQEWTSELKVEEFTNFILLIHTQYEKDNFRTSLVVKHLIPIIKWASPYLQNVAFFDKDHKCIFYLKENNIKEIEKHKELSRKAIEESIKEGANFTLFNSINVPLKIIEGHMFLPVTIYGDYGAHDEVIMFDTGASMTVLPLEIIKKTANEGDGETEPRRLSFTTANGLMTCYIINRNIVIGGIDKFISVAINENDNMSLLGVDFFNDKNYVIDTKKEYLYIWDK